MIDVAQLKGTFFQKKVWKELLKIPRGKTATYKQIAQRIGHPKAVRAVGSAVAKNPLVPMIPCHRVVRSDGNLGGYSGRGGIRQKRRLLKKEKAI